MENSKAQIPVTFCRFCEQDLPVVIKEIDLAEFEQNQTLNSDLRELIYCPGCSNILNVDRELTVEWYDAHELHKAINYKVVGENE